MPQCKRPTLTTLPDYRNFWAFHAFIMVIADNDPRYWLCRYDGEKFKSLDYPSWLFPPRPAFNPR